MSCYRVLKSEGLIQPGRPAVALREIRDRRRQMLEIPKGVNEVLQCDFTDYETEDGESYHIGCVTEYLSRFNLVSKVLYTETAFDLIDVTEMAMREIANVGHTLPKRIVLVTDNGPGDEVAPLSELYSENGFADPRPRTEISSADDRS